MPVFTGSATVGNSAISVLGSSVGIGTASPAYRLDVAGDLRVSAANPYIYINGTFPEQPNLGSIGVRSAGEIVLDANTNNSAIPNWEIKYGSGTNGNFPVDAFYVGRAPSPTGTLTEFFVIKSSGNVGIGTTAPGAALEVNGSVKLTASSGASITFQDGTAQTTAWTGVLCGGDYAEAVKAAGKKQTYEPGDVLVLTSDSNSDVQKSSKPYSTMVAGIYATKPGVIGKRQSLKDESSEVPMAMVGIVPTKVTTKNGPIHRGDLLVSSSVLGYAMRGTDRSRLVGAVIDKAMGSLDSGQGVIEVLVTLQ